MCFSTLARQHLFKRGKSQGETETDLLKRGRQKFGDVTLICTIIVRTGFESVYIAQVLAMLK